MEYIFRIHRGRADLIEKEDGRTEPSGQIVNFSHDMGRVVASGSDKFITAIIKLFPGRYWIQDVYGLRKYGDW